MPDPSWTWRLALHAYDLDSSGHLPAVKVTYDHTASLLVATNVQAAIDEIVAATGGTGKVWRPVMYLNGTLGEWLPVVTGSGDAVMVLA